METDQQFKTIVIDPPWPGPGSTPNFRKNKSGKSEVSLIPYSTMSGFQLSAMRVDQTATTDAQLWMWATSRSMGDAMLLVQLWNFAYRGLFVWKKPGLGMGRHMRHQCEFLIYAGRPGAKLVQPKKCPRQFQEWPTPKAHSEKPPEAYDMIRELSDGPRIDIFARQSRPGFTPWGNQTDLLDKQDD